MGQSVVVGSTVHVELGDAIEEHPLIPRRAVTGHALTRRRALRHPERRRLWEIADVLIEEDSALAVFLDGTGG